MSSQQSQLLISEAVCSSCDKKVSFRPPMTLSRFIGSSTQGYWECYVTDPSTGDKQIVCPKCDYTGPVGLLYVLTPQTDHEK
jgi:hypothetical protein